MQIRFEPTIEDQVEASLYWQKHSSGYKKRFWSVLLIGLLAGFLVIGSIDADHRLSMTIFIAITLGAGFAYSHFVGRRRQIGKILSKSKLLQLDGGRTLTLHPEYISSESPLDRSDFRWDLVGKIDQTEKYIFIDIGGISILPIPRRAFDSEDDFHAFYNLAVQYRQACMGH